MPNWPTRLHHRKRTTIGDGEGSCSQKCLHDESISEISKLFRWFGGYISNKASGGPSRRQSYGRSNQGINEVAIFFRCDEIISVEAVNGIPLTLNVILKFEFSRSIMSCSRKCPSTASHLVGEKSCVIFVTHSGSPSRAWRTHDTDALRAPICPCEAKGCHDRAKEVFFFLSEKILNNNNSILRHGRHQSLRKN